MKAGTSSAPFRRASPWPWHECLPRSPTTLDQHEIAHFLIHLRIEQRLAVGGHREADKHRPRDRDDRRDPPIEAEKLYRGGRSMASPRDEENPVIQRSKSAPVGNPCDNLDFYPAVHGLFPQRSVAACSLRVIEDLAVRRLQRSKASLGGHLNSPAAVGASLPHL